MTSDPDLVLKSFSETSETQFSLLYIMQLFIAVEENKTRNAYEIPQEDALRLCAAPGRLPAPLHDFIIWQKNILKLDDGEVLATELPRGLKTKYPLKASRLAEIESREDREALIKDLIDELDEYFTKFNEVRAILEATEDRFLTVEDSLLRAESMDGGVSSVVHEQKTALEAMRNDLTNLRSDLEDDVLPDIIKFEHTPDKAKALMVTLSDTHLKIRDAIRRHNLSQDY